MMNICGTTDATNLSTILKKCQILYCVMDKAEFLNTKTVEINNTTSHPVKQADI